MSHPLSNLKKQKKTPFSTHGSLGTPPGRNVPYRNVGYSVDESRLFDEIAGNLPTDKFKDVSSNRLPQDGAQQGKTASPTANAGSSDHELMSMMMSRLSQLEQKVQYKNKELGEKDKKVRILEDKVRILQKAKDNSDPGRAHHLEKKCLLLQQQVHEMETFLMDYGMIWMGEKTEPDSKVYVDDDVLEDSEDNEDEDGLTMTQVHNKLWAPGAAVPTDFKVDFDLVLKNLQELNELAGEGIGQIQRTTDGARLKMPDPIQLTLYANGILMFSGPFRPYTEQSTQRCIQDLTDGYFPSELQTRYPDGIPFKVTDKRKVHFKDRLSDVFEGHGQLLGGDTKPSRLVPSNLDRGRNKSKSTQATDDDSHLEQTSQLPGRQFSMEQFLQKLPSSVIKEGKVIDIRNAVGDELTGSGGPSTVTVIETEAVKGVKDTIEHKRRSANTRDLTTLRIKTEKGDHTYILKMESTNTIKDVQNYVDKHRSRGAPPYQIVSTFPKQIYSDMNKTLKQYGLTPNATLHLQAKNTK